MYRYYFFKNRHPYAKTCKKANKYKRFQTTVLRGVFSTLHQSLEAKFSCKMY